MIYGGFEIQSFEAGRGLWHARIQRADHAPVQFDFPLPRAIRSGDGVGQKIRDLITAAQDRLKELSRTGVQTPAVLIHHLPVFG